MRFMLILSCCLIVALAGAQTVVLNGTPTKLSAYSAQDIIYVEAAAFVRALGGTLTYDNIAQQVTVTAGEQEINVTAIEKNGKAYASVAALARVFGLTVRYDKQKKQVIIGKGSGDGLTGQFGVTCTLGKATPMNFTLQRVEYNASRVIVGETTLLPTREQKLLVLYFVVQNPQKLETLFDASTLRFTAIDIDEKTYDNLAEIGIAQNGQSLNTLSMKPLQKMALYAVIPVPAAGAMPTLQVAPMLGSDADGAAVRFDLRDKVAGMPAPIADEADATGATARGDVPATLRLYYPLGIYDIMVESAAYSTKPFYNDPLPEGGRFLVVTARVKNMSKVAVYFTGATLKSILTVKGVKEKEVAVIPMPLLGSGDKPAEQEIKAGGELQIRFLYVVEKNAVPKDVAFFEWGMGGSENNLGRAYRFELPEVK